MGGKGGDLWEMINPILKKDPNAEGKIYFFPWYDDPVAVKTDGMVTAEAEDYFRELGDRLGKKFNPEQKRWWISKKLEQGIFMTREYPSTLDEAFRAPVEGAIYAKRMDEARAESRIKEFPWDRSFPVHTLWDLGSPQNTRTVYFQMIGREIHIIDHDTGLDHGPTERVAHIRGKGYPLGNHYLPHDAGIKEYSGLSYEEQLAVAGLHNIKVVPRCVEEWTGINKVNELIPRMLFHAGRCESLVASLEAYHTKEDASDGHMTSKPVHDWSSHDCDAMRVMGEAMGAGLLKDGTTAGGGGVRVLSPIEGLGGGTGRRSVRVINPM